MTTTSKKTHTGLETEEAFRQTEQGYRSLIENSSDIIALINTEGIVTYVSPSITPILGYTPQEIVGCHARDLVHPDDLDIMQRVLEEIGQTLGRSLSAEYRLHCKDGSWRWFEGNETNLLQVPGIGAIVGNFRDITKQKLALPLNWGEMSESEHFVQFYETHAFLLDSLSGFISTGLDAGDACIVIATKTVRELLEERLKANGLDLAAAHTQDKYISLDAVETLSKFMVDGLPEPERFAEVIGSIIVRAAKGRGHVRIFGEMVAQLWTEGNQTAAIHLEELWNDLYNKPYPFSLFCAYSMHGFAGETNRVQFTEICKQHSRVIPDESYTALASSDERLRAITLLQQKANSLQAEIAERKLAEERLQISESRYRRLFETSKDGILIVDPRTHTITDANPFMTELLGYTREQLLGQELWQIGLFQDRETNLEVLRDLQEKHLLRYETLPLQTKDGQHREVDFVTTLYQADGGQVIQCNIRDITDRKRAEEALLHLAAIVESSDDAILSKNLEGIITSWNAAAERIYGYSAQEIVGQPVTLLFAPDRQDEFTQIMMRIRRGQRVDPYETIRVRKDGTFLTVSVTVSPIKDSTGTIIGASAIARNITEHKRLEAKFRQLFNSNLIGVFVSDFAGTFLDANDAFLDLLGYTRAELQAGTVLRDALTPPEFHYLSQNAVKALQETGTSGTYEKEYLHKSGKRIPVLVAVTRIEQSETGIGFVLDISERKELDKRKDEFISMASHELKTPVTSLKGFLSLLQRRMTIQGEEKSLYYLACMDAQVNKLIKLINDLLDLSKMQTGQLNYREERFEVAALVQEIVENVQETTKTHHLLLEEQTLAEVFGDRDRIGQVLINLLNNAIKYSPQADTVLVRVAKDQNKALVSVQDFGIGIAKEHQQKIFERFYQVTDPEEKTYPGLGIGLYISCEIVKRHGGQVWVESKKGRGSTFHFTLPLV
ncbi:MAG: PAS domain S-box protein [Ktedonobacteraceae bacterium]